MRFAGIIVAGLMVSVAWGAGPKGTKATAPKSAKAAPARESVAGARRLAESLNCTADFFEVAGCPAFLILPPGLGEVRKGESPIPWVWYAPTLGSTPHVAHVWMLRQFLEHGIAFAGIDVGESYGNPEGRAKYTAFWEELRTRRGMAERAILLPQSRGGLMLYNWAAEHPEGVAAIAGIYTVCDMASWPGLAKAAPAYKMTEAELGAHLADNNPIDRLAPLAKAGVPILHIHGDNDKVVPLERNSGELAKRYRALGGTMRVIIVPGKGHEVVPEFFESQAFVDFVLEQARKLAPKKDESRH